MKLENQVCTLEQSKILENLLGEDIESSFYWADNGCNQFHLSMPCNKGFVTVDEDGEVYTESGADCYNAFTVAELGDMLPNGFDTIKISRYDDFKRSGWKPYDDSDDNPLGYEIFFDTEAQARAAMLIYLIAKKIVKVEEINKRLSET